MRKTLPSAFVDFTVPPCTSGTECSGIIRLEATGEFHINKEYPYKIVVDEVPGVQFLGGDGGRTFGRMTGHFAQASEKIALLTIRFKPASPGKMRLAGTFKMSVCTAAECKMDPADLLLDVDVR